MLYKKSIIALLLCCIGCISSQKSFERGNYEKSYKSALKALKKGQSYKAGLKAFKRNQAYDENIDMLSLSLTKILDQESRAKETLKRSENLEAKEKAISINQKLQTKIKKAELYLRNDFKEKKESLIEEEEILIKEVSSGYFELGKRKLELGEQNSNKEEIKQSYNNFIKSRKYGNKEGVLDSLINKSYELAQVIYHVDVSALSNLKYNWEIDSRFKGVESYSGEFRKIYYESCKKINGVDCDIKIRLWYLNFDLEEVTEEKQFSKEVVTGKETIVNSSGEKEEVDKKEEVKGKVIIKQIEKTAEWEARIRLITSSNNCALSGTNIAESLISEIEEIKLEGDERAIPQEYKNQKEEKLKSDDEMAEELIEMLYTRTIGHLF